MSRDRLPIYWIASAIALTGYAALNHYVTAYRPGSWLAVLFPLAPVAIAVVAVVWRSRLRYPLLALAIALSPAVWRWSDGAVLRDQAPYIYLAEHVGFNVVLGWVFGRTLMAGREPLCASLARAVHGEIPPEVERYTGKVTAAWAAFFAGITVVSTLLFFFASIDVWSFFVNFVNLPLVVAMFLIEYRIRLRVLPEFPHAPILAGFRSFKASSKSAEAAADSMDG